jgi:hypothetical protein
MPGVVVRPNGLWSTATSVTVEINGDILRYIPILRTKWTRGEFTVRSDLYTNGLAILIEDNLPDGEDTVEIPFGQAFIKGEKPIVIGPEQGKPEKLILALFDKAMSKT